jgi:hypothetical protein
MDIFAHTLWTNAAARGANEVVGKKDKGFHIHPGWAGFWGVFPDFFAFTVPFIIGMYNLLFNPAYEGGFGPRMIHHSGFDLAAFLYQFSHSLVIWALVFVLVWVIRRRPKYELLGWALHILIDIPSHVLAFYPTPFLFPISEYRFPYGIQWSNMWYMIINYSLLAVVWIGIQVKRNKHNNK